MVYYVKSRKEGKKLNSVKYFTGEKCKNGHIDFRYTKSTACCSCTREYARKDYKKNGNKARLRAKKWREKNSEKKKILDKEYRKNNKKKFNIYSKKWVKNNKEKYKKKRKECYKRKSKDSSYRLNSSISTAVYNWLKKEKGYRQWENIVGYTLQDVKKHLEERFKAGMTWDNYGYYWHVDHIKPLSLCESFEEAWKLENLQPLEAKKNMSKGNRYIG